MGEEGKRGAFLELRAKSGEGDAPERVVRASAALVEGEDGAHAEAVAVPPARRRGHRPRMALVIPVPVNRHRTGGSNHHQTTKRVH